MAEFIPYRDNEYAGVLMVEAEGGVKVSVMFDRDDPSKTSVFLSKEAIALLPPEIQVRWSG